MYSKSELQANRNEEYGEYILSKIVKSVHRTYFLDVRATKGEDLFVTITESRKRQNTDGSQYYDRRKIVLYKEDIQRFCEEFGNITQFLQENRPHYFEKAESGVEAPNSEEAQQVDANEFSTEAEAIIESDVRFEDL